MPSIDELLEEHARMWRDHVDEYSRSKQASADARQLVASGQATALVTACMNGKVVDSYEVLAGRAPKFTTLNIAVPAGRYLLLLGGTPGSYYAAFVLYGVYHLTGGHALQLCAYQNPYESSRAARHGITDVHHLVELLEDALHRQGSRDVVHMIHRVPLRSGR